MENLAQRVSQCYAEACWLELHALKPGNVGHHAEGHGMTVDQFVDSAQVSAIALTEPSASVGERIYKAVQATRKQVGDNTNLGIVLLAAPIIEAVLLQDSVNNLRSNLKVVLEQLTVNDARDCYTAIRLANPGGRGAVGDQDINNEPDITLLEAMRLAETRDRIAFQYTHDYSDIFEYNLIIYKDFLNKWRSSTWAATAVFLSQWMRAPDSLISRKHGVLKAQEISDMIAPLAVQVLASQDPMEFETRLLSIDGHLKNIGINPGTTADLTVATLFVAMLESASIGGYPKDKCT